MRIAKADKEDFDELRDYFLKKEDKGYNVPNGWRRIYMAAQSLIESCCDPTESHLAYSPYLEEKHVDNEQ